MKFYFAIAEGWKPETAIGDIEYARRKAVEILKKSGRKVVSVYSINGSIVAFVGHVHYANNGKSIRYTDMTGNIDRSINQDGSLRAKPSPKPFLR